MKTPLKVIRKEYPRIRVRVKGNTTSYEVDCRSVRWTGQPYFSFPTQTEAIEKAKEVAKAVAHFGISGLNHEDIKLLARIRRKLSPFHLGPEEAIDQFIQSREKSVTLQKTQLVKDISPLYLADKETGFHRKLADKTLIGIKTTCNALNKCFGEAPIGSITPDEVKTALAKHWSNPASRKDYIIRFRTFFKWCIGKKFIKGNPCGTKDRGDAIVFHADKPDTQILPKDDILTLLGSVLDEPKMIPFYALSLFGGMREAACSRIEWPQIYLDERRIIHVTNKISKTYEHNTPILPVLAEWLAPYVGQDICPTNHRKLYDAVRKGIPWQRDIMRHTAVSYFMGKYNEIGRVSEMLGTSAQMIKKHYQVPALVADVEWFWSLTPTKVRELIEEKKKLAAQ